MNWFTKKAAEGDDSFNPIGLLDRIRSALGSKSPKLDTSYLSRLKPPISKAKPTLEDVLRHIVKANPNVDLDAVADELYDRGVTPDRVDEAALEDLLYPTRPAPAEYKSLHSPENSYRLGKDGGLNRLAAIANGAPAIAQPEIDFSPIYETALRQAAEEPTTNVAPFSEKNLSPYMRAMASPYDPVVFPDIKAPKSLGSPTIRSAVDLARDNIDVSHIADDILGAPVEAADVEGLLGQFASPRYKMKFNMPNMAPESLGEVPMGYYAPLEGTEWDRVQASLEAKRGFKPSPEDDAYIAKPDNIPAGAPSVAQPEIDFAGAAEPVVSPLAINPAELEGQIPSPQYDTKFNMPNMAPESLGEVPMGYYAPLEGTEWDRVQASLEAKRGFKPSPEDEVSAPEATSRVTPNIWNQRNEERRYVIRPGGKSYLVRTNNIPDGAPPIAQPEIDFAGAIEPVAAPLEINPEEFYMTDLEPEEAPGLTLGDIEDSTSAASPFAPVEAPSLDSSLNTQVLDQGPIYNFLDQLRAVENTPGSSLSDFPIRQ